MVLFAIGESWGWGRPLGELIVGHSTADYEWYQKGILKKPIPALIVRGFLWGLPVSLLAYWDIQLLALPIIFAFTTILGWSYYGERCAEFVFGTKVIQPYRVLWVLAIMAGATGTLEFIWLLADVLNGMMAIPNLIALAVLSPVIFRLTRDYANR